MPVKPPTITVLARSCVLVAGLLVQGLLIQAAEPPFAPPAPDPIPTAVRTAAAHLAKDGRLEVFTVTGVAPDLRYQVRLIDVATDQPVMATFAGDGTLLSVLSLPSGAKSGPAPSEALPSPPRSERPDGHEGPPAIPPADKPSPIPPQIPAH